MRLALKLISAALAIACLALSAATANAQSFEVIDEESFNHCGETTLIGHFVSGGCNFETESESHIAMVVQTAGGPVTVANCNWHLEGRVDEAGAGWFTEALLASEPPPGTVPGCTRAACDEANGGMRPWPFVGIESGPGSETVELTLCVRTVASGPGGAGTSCELHLPFLDNGDHDYELGVGSTQGCENLPPLSFQGIHLVNEVPGGWDLEVSH